jgi:hypothetical protein
MKYLKYYDLDLKHIKILMKIHADLPMDFTNF